MNIFRIDRKRISMLPKAVISDGLALCPHCWHVLCEPLEGEGKVGIWCRMCKRHYVVEMKGGESNG